jgi:5-methylcytosine-specific restriction endonuclease McrA
MEKKCCTCLETKPIINFYICRSNLSRNCKSFYGPNCKSCVKLDRKEYRKKNKEYLSNYHKEKYKSKRKEIIARNVKYEARKMKTDPIFKLKKTIRMRLRIALKMLKNKKLAGFYDYIGCKPEELKKHLESKFYGNMNWSNHGSYWHIDHIIPISKFDLSTLDGQLKANHFSNLQPLTALDNLMKGTK